jgi:hypothetical protein
MKWWPKTRSGKLLSLTAFKWHELHWWLLIPVGWLANVVNSFVQAITGLLWVFYYLCGCDMEAFDKEVERRREERRRKRRK